MPVVGVAMLMGVPEMMSLMLSVVGMLLANAMWSSWDLLVRIAQAKRRAAQVEPDRWIEPSL